MRTSLSRTAEKQLEKLPEELAKRLAVAIKDLEGNPFPRNSEKLSGKPYYRLRVGDYRVLYAVLTHERTIVISRIAHRREVYRSL